jgi:hypothetical protein
MEMTSDPTYVNSNYLNRLQWTVADLSIVISLNPSTITNGTDIPLYIQFPGIIKKNSENDGSPPVQVSLPAGTSAEFAAADLPVATISFVKPA